MCARARHGACVRACASHARAGGVRQLRRASERALRFAPTAPARAPGGAEQGSCPLTTGQTTAGPCLSGAAAACPTAGGNRRRNRRNRPAGPRLWAGLARASVAIDTALKRHKSSFSTSFSIDINPRVRRGPRCQHRHRHGFTDQQEPARASRAGSDAAGRRRRRRRRRRTRTVGVGAERGVEVALRLAPHPRRPLLPAPPQQRPAAVREPLMYYI